MGRQGEGYMWAFSHGNAGQVLDRRKSVQLGLLQNWFQGGLKENVRGGRGHARGGPGRSASDPKMFELSRHKTTLLFKRNSRAFCEHLNFEVSRDFSNQQPLQLKDSARGRHIYQHLLPLGA